jgi:hypothetical protein
MNQGRRASPVVLAPFDRKTDALQVIIETPKGSWNKYAFDESQEIFLLKRVLPAGMGFPYDSVSCLALARKMAIRWTFWW